MQACSVQYRPFRGILQQEHPGFSKEVLLYNTLTDSWEIIGRIPFDTPVTTTAVNWGNTVFIPGGEIKAGVRTPNILSVKIENKANESLKKISLDCSGIAWVVALLNYMDRQMLSTMKPSMQIDIHELQTAADFGYLMAVFLWIYGFMSPLSGIIADRVNRKWLIVCSLFVWSIIYCSFMVTTLLPEKNLLFNIYWFI